MTAPVLVDVEAELVAWIRSNVPGVMRVVTETPANLADVVPLVQVFALPAVDRRLGLLATPVDLDCFALTRPAARALALQVAAAVVYQLPGMPFGAGTVTHVDLSAGPSWRPYDDTAVRRVGVTVDLYVHPR